MPVVGVIASVVESVVVTVAVTVAVAVAAAAVAAACHFAVLTAAKKSKCRHTSERGLQPHQHDQPRSSHEDPGTYCGPTVVLACAPCEMHACCQSRSWKNDDDDDDVVLVCLRSCRT